MSRLRSRDGIAFFAGAALGAAAMRAWSLRAAFPARAGKGLEGRAAVAASMERMHGLLGEIRALMGRPAPAPGGGAVPASGEGKAGRASPAAVPSRRDAWRTPDHLHYGAPEVAFPGSYSMAALSALSALAGVAAARAALRAAGKGDALPAVPAAAGAVLAAAWLGWSRERGGAAGPWPAQVR